VRLDKAFQFMHVSGLGARQERNYVFHRDGTVELSRSSLFAGQTVGGGANISATGPGVAYHDGGPNASLLVIGPASERRVRYTIDGYVLELTADDGAVERHFIARFGDDKADDPRLLKLIRAFLTAGVMENGLVSASVEGTPQGGPLSPLLSNLVLDELDRELERRGHRFVRYADDCDIFVRSERAGQRVMTSLVRFITQKPKLKVNEAKSAVAQPRQRKFLGFSFSDGPTVMRTIAPKALERFKQRIRDITRRARGTSVETIMAELATYMRGWRGYFGFCETPQVLLVLMRWVRVRLRSALWRQWKTPSRRRAALIALGVSPWLAEGTAGSVHGPWRLARSKALSRGLNNAYFRSLGLPALVKER
jgi:RNA-directed DNA polymerase